MPTTQFEDTGFSEWTSLSSEATYLSDLAAQEARLDHESVGTSFTGEEMWRVRIGEPVPMDRCGLLILAGVHGDEPSGREAALIYMRTLAQTTDSALVSFLEDEGVWIMPTLNPDNIGQGTDNGTRENGNGNDLNREYNRLVEGEIQAVVEQMRAGDPFTAIDAHELTPHSTTDHSVQPGKPSNDSVHPDLTAEIDDFLTQIADDAVATVAGWQWSFYSGGAEDRNARNSFGMHHVLGWLLEAEGQDFTDPPKETRKDIQVELYDLMVRYAQNNTESMRSVAHASHRDKVQEGRAATATFSGNGFTIDPPPAAYELTQSQIDATKTARRTWGIWAVDGVVPMGQKGQPRIPHQLDGAAPHNLVNATRLSSVPTLTKTSRLSGGSWSSGGASVQGDGTWTSRNPLLLASLE